MLSTRQIRCRGWSDRGAEIGGDGHGAGYYSEAGPATYFVEQGVIRVPQQVANRVELKAAFVPPGAGFCMIPARRAMRVNPIAALCTSDSAVRAAGFWINFGR